MTFSLIDGATGNVQQEIEHKRQEKSINVFSRSAAIDSLPPVRYIELPWGIGGSIGPEGEGNTLSPAVITFIRIIGSVGMASSGFVFFIGALTSVNRINKLINA